MISPRSSPNLGQTERIILSEQWINHDLQELFKGLFQVTALL
jgi:hypothetical protein